MLLTDNVIESRGMVARAKGIKTRKALFNLPLAIKHLDIALPVGSSDVMRIAAYLGVGEREIEDALAHAAGDVMLDEPVGENGALRGEIIADERAEDEAGILNRLSNEGRWNAVCEEVMALAGARPLHPDHPLPAEPEMEARSPVGHLEDVARTDPPDWR